MLQMDSEKDNQNPDSSNSNTQPFSSPNQIEQPLVPQEHTGNAPNDIASSWHILSIFSWLFLICTIMNIVFGRMSFGYPEGTILYVDSQFISFYMLIISIIGLSIMVKRTVYDQDANFMNGLFGEQSKLHSIGLLFGAGVFICLHIGFETENPSYSSSRSGSGIGSTSSALTKFLVPLYSISLSLSAIGFCALLYAYSKIDTQYEWYEVITIKKGTFSSLIAFLWFSLFYSASRLGLYRDRKSSYYSDDYPYNQSYNDRYDYPKNRNSSGNLIDDMKGMSIAFTIIIGAFNLGFSAYKKDLGPAAVNLIIYISNAIYVFSPSFFPINDEFENVMSMIMVFFSFVTFTYLIMKNLDSVMKV
jgi:hypothetical protein